MQGRVKKVAGCYILFDRSLSTDKAVDGRKVDALFWSCNCWWARQIEGGGLPVRWCLVFYRCLYSFLIDLSVTVCHCLLQYLYWNAVVFTNLVGHTVEDSIPRVVLQVSTDYSMLEESTFAKSKVRRESCGLWENLIVIRSPATCFGHVLVGYSAFRKFHMYWIDHNVGTMILMQWRFWWGPSFNVVTDPCVNANLDRAFQMCLQSSQSWWQFCIMLGSTAFDYMLVPVSIHLIRFDRRNP